MILKYSDVLTHAGRKQVFTYSTESSSMSHGWRSVLAGRNLLLENLGWVVGNGTSINIWNDPWLSLAYQERPMGPPNKPHSQVTVSDLINPATRDWDVSKIKLILPFYEEKILCFKPSLTGAPDKQVWLATKSGDYTTKSGYYTAVTRVETRQDIPTDNGFKWRSNVWNMQCAPKVKLFSWKLLKGAIPVGERLVQRRVPADPRCKRCGCSESILHLFFQCGFAQRVWHLAPLNTDMDFRGIIDLMSSWETLCSLKCLPPAGIISGSLTPWLFWSIWKARNKFVFEGHSASPEETLSGAIVLAREWNTEVKKEPLTGIRQLSAPVLTHPEATVIRSDAAWAPGSNIAGLGWVLLSHSGNQSFKVPLKSVASPLLAEGLALREAVRSCATLGLNYVAFESDSLNLIKAVKLEVTIAELYSVIADITSFASVFEFVSFSWISREKNVLADCLAKEALNVSDTLVVGDAFIAPN